MTSKANDCADGTHQRSRHTKNRIKLGDVGNKNLDISSNVSFMSLQMV